MVIDDHGLDQKKCGNHVLSSQKIKSMENAPVLSSTTLYLVAFGDKMDVVASDNVVPFDGK